MVDAREETKGEGCHPPSGVGSSLYVREILGVVPLILYDAPIDVCRVHNVTNVRGWPVRLNGRAFARDPKSRGFESRPVCFHVTALGKLLTRMCLCHQAV